MTGEAAENPYVGPRPFTIHDRSRFFGRDKEARDLIPLVISERLVLFYAQSGAGKSSLINARLIPGLRERNFVVLPVGRVSGDAGGDLAVDNIFVYNLLVSLDRQKGQYAGSPAALAQMTLPEYLANLEMESAPGAEPKEPGASGPVTDAPQVIEGVQPLALIIDQFEEIFTNHPQAWKQRAPFFEQLCQAMEADPYLWVVITIREDYIAALDPYAYLLPGRLRARFYMQRMEYQAALEAVKKPVASLRPFEQGAAEELVNNLRRIPVRAGKDQEPQMVESQYVEPVQLQVVCYQLWENLKDSPGSQISNEDLGRLAKDLAQFVSRALADFYEQALDKILKDPTVKISERRLRDWFGSELITEGETRGAVFQGDTHTGSLPNDVVRLLEAQFIIRAETRASGKWYELSHDRFIAPILQANRAWHDQHQNPVALDAEAYLAGKGRLYEGPQLEEAMQKMQAAPDDFSPEEMEFLRKSQETENQRTTRRQRIGIGLLVLLLLIFAWLTFSSVRNAQTASANQVRAEENERQALAAEGDALNQKETAEAAGEEALRQQKIAETQRAYAQEQADLAQQRLVTVDAYSENLAAEASVAKTAQAEAQAASIQAREEAQKAEAARQQAQAGQLASYADSLRTDNLNLSLILALEAMNLHDNWDTRGTLFESLQRGLSNTLEQLGGPITPGQRPSAVTFSPVGQLLAVGLMDGSVTVHSTDGGGRIEVPADFKSLSQVNSVAFSPDGQLLAQGNRSGNVRIWDLSTQKVTWFEAVRVTVPEVLSVAFQPKGGELLAVATQVDSQSGAGRVIFYNYIEGRVDTRYQWNCGRASCTVLAWSPDGKQLAAGTGGGQWSIYDLEKREEVKASGAVHTAQILGIAWYPDNRTLVTAGLDRRLVKWDTDRVAVLKEASRVDSAEFRSLSISPDGSYLLAGVSGEGNQEWALLYDAETLERLDKHVYQHSRSVVAVAFNAQGNRFATAGSDTYVYLWKFEPVNPLSREIPNPAGGKVDSILQDSSGRRVWTSAGKISLPDSDLTITVPGSYASIAGLKLQGKPAIGVGGYDGSILFIDLASGRPARGALNMGAGQLRSLAFDDAGSQAAAAVCTGANQCDRVVVRSLLDERAAPVTPDISTYQLEQVTSLAFSRDGERLAIGSIKGDILVYNLKDGSISPLVTEGLNLQGAGIVVASLAFSSTESDLLAAGFHDGRVALWKASSLGPIGVYSERVRGMVTVLSFGPAEGSEAGVETLLAGSERGELREYITDLGEWKKLACRIANNQALTPEEREKFNLDPNPPAPICP